MYVMSNFFDVNPLIRKIGSENGKSQAADLAKVKSKLRGHILTITSENFKILLSLLKNPNPKILNYVLSILGDLCVKGRYWVYFTCIESVKDIILILNSIDQYDILCRTWRMIGNVAKNKRVAKLFISNGVLEPISVSLAKLDSTPDDTTKIFLRAIRYLWNQGDVNAPFVEEFLERIEQCLVSSNSYIVHFGLDAIGILYTHKNSSPRCLKQLVELSKDDSYQDQCIKYVSYFTKNRCWEHEDFLTCCVEEMFLDVFQSRHIEEDFMLAFLALCQQSTMRCKVKVANLLPQLITIGLSHHPNVILKILASFRFDDESMQLITKCDNFPLFVKNNMKYDAASELLSTLAYSKIVPLQFCSSDYLDVLLETRPRCMSKLLGSPVCFGTILLSGKVWALSDAGYEMDQLEHEDYGRYAESIVVNYLNPGDVNTQRLAAMAAPFLVKRSSSALIHKLLVKHQALSVILNTLLVEDPISEATAVTLVRLASLLGPDKEKDTVLQIPRVEPPTRVDPDDIQLNFDDGSSLLVSKRRLCSLSEVFDRMLTGHFVEASQTEVKFPDCTKYAFVSVMNLIEHGRLESVNLRIRLQMITLAERLLLLEVADFLSQLTMRMPDIHHYSVHRWACEAGLSTNAVNLRTWACWGMLKEKKVLMNLHKQDCSQPVIEDISALLVSSANDL